MSLKVARATSDLYATGRLLYQWADRLAYPTGLRMVQLCHGYPATPAQFASIGAIIDALISSGRYLPFAADQGGTNLWGGTGVATDIEAANTFIAGLHSARTTKFALIGYSMGFLNATAEVIAHAAKVPVVVGIAPATNGAHLYADNGGQMAIDMDASPGASGSWAGVDATRSPIQRSSVFAGVHVECWQGTSDVTVRPADTSAFCTAVGGTYHPVAGDHSTIWSSVTGAAVLAALDAGDWS